MNARRFLRADHLSAAVAVLLLAYRFCNLDLVTLINDEPHLLAAAEQEAHGGAWVSASPISGTQGVHYGPVPTWFYGVVHLLFGASPLVSIVAMGLVVTLGQLIFLVMLTRFLRGGSAMFGALTALVASSPFAFAWSRTAWDNTILVGTFACASLLLAEEELTPKRCLIAGILYGLAIGSHLMVLPALIAMFALTLWIRRRAFFKTVRASAIVAAPAIVINVPYAIYLSKLPHPPPAPPIVSASVAHGFDFSNAAATVVTTFLQPARILSLDGIAYFFDDAWGDFRSWLGGWSFVLDDASFAFVIALMALAGIFLSAFRAPSANTRRLASLALVAWLGHALFLAADGLAPHPHYQHPVWWTIPTGIALLTLWLRARSPHAARAIIGISWVFAIAQFSFLPMWMRYIHERGGTRGIHYTTPVADEERFMRGACSQGDDIQIENHTVIYAVPLDYIAATDPACKGKRVALCNGSCGGGAPGTKVVQLRYQGPGARLATP
jgi:hypothetical protein